MAEQNNVQVPTENVELPSKGLLYNENTDLKNGVVELRYLVGKDEDILTSKKLIQNGEVFEKLLNNIIVSDINYDDLLIVDRDALLIMARIMAYGSEYEFKQVCPNCGEVNHKTVDLQNITYEEIDEDFLRNSNNIFEFTLPKSGMEIKFKFLTVKDHNEISKEVENLEKVKKKNQGSDKSKEGLTSKIDHTSSTALSYAITEINGSSDFKYISDFVKNKMILQDIRELRKYMDEISPSIDTSYHFDCDECGYEDTLDIKIDVNFFWPQA